MAANIASELAAPYLIEGAAITITASVGIAIHRVDAHCYGELLRVSDLAMYREKARRPEPPRIVRTPSRPSRRVERPEDFQMLQRSSLLGELAN